MIQLSVGGEVGEAISPPFLVGTVIKEIVKQLASAIAVVKLILLGVVFDNISSNLMRPN